MVVGLSLSNEQTERNRIRKKKKNHNREIRGFFFFFVAFFKHTLDTSKSLAQTPSRYWRLSFLSHLRFEVPPQPSKTVSYTTPLGD
jgi:hypothetical protein